MSQRKSGPRDYTDPRTRRKKACPVIASGITEVDYKDLELLRNFITDRGKILPRRITGVSQTTQRKICLAIKRARHVALLPYTAD